MLAMSLMDTGTVVPILVLVTKSVSQGMIDILENIGCEVYKTESITLPQELSLQTERWGPAFTKLVAWKRTDFSKLVFIDSDTLVLKNIDQLFAVSDSLLAAVDTDASSCRFDISFFFLYNNNNNKFKSLRKPLNNNLVLKRKE